MQFPKILISGDYSAFQQGYTGQGIYFASGLNESESFSLNGYLGSTDDLYRRLKCSHIPALNAGTHENPVFQNAWNKYGPENFVWFQLQETTPEIQFQVEQKFLDELRPFADEGRGFNIAKDALKPPSHKGVKRSEEFKKKVSEAQSGERGYWYGVKGKDHPNFGKKKSPESIEKSRLSRIGFKQTQEQKDKVSAALKGKKKSPEHIKNAREARIKAGFHYTEEQRKKMSEMRLGKKQSEETKIKKGQALSKEFALVSPAGQLLKIKGKSKFCKEFHLSTTNLNALLNKKRDIYKGWTRAPDFLDKLSENNCDIKLN